MCPDAHLSPSHLETKSYVSFGSDCILTKATLEKNVAVFESYSDYFGSNWTWFRQTRLLLPFMSLHRGLASKTPPHTLQAALPYLAGTLVHLDETLRAVTKCLSDKMMMNEKKYHFWPEFMLHIICGRFLFWLCPAEYHTLVGVGGQWVFLCSTQPLMLLLGVFFVNVWFVEC